MVGRAVYEPGWRWSTAMPAIAGTASCQLHHLGYSISGVMHVVTEDGQEIDIPPASVYEIPPGHDAWVVGDDPWVTVEWTSARTFGRRPRGARRGSPRHGAVHRHRRLHGHSAKDGRHGLARPPDAHNRLLRDQLNVFRGREVKTTGDGFLAVFDSATRAVRCGARDGALRSQDWVSRSGSGVHTGEVEFVGNDARGLAVHAAARVMSLGGPGEVFVSSTTNDFLEGSGLILEDAGSQELKGLAGERRLFRLVAPTT